MPGENSVVPKWAIIAAIGLAGFFGYRHLNPKSSFAADGREAYWDAAVAQSKSAGKPGLVFVTADWCGACQSFKGQVLSQSHVLEAMYSRHTVVVLDITDPGSPAAERARALGVRGVPTLIRYDENGKDVARTHGMPADALMKWLAKP
jgi:thiol:disulfide interchange protein